ncbi:MAG: TonB-dependent receptor [Vicinamibacterales bacterium]
MLTYIRRVSALVFLLTLLALSALAAAPGRLHGVVQDQSGALVPGAAILVVDTATGRTHSATTDQRGQFSVDGLPPGRYDVAAALAGFDTDGRAGLAVTDGSDEAVTLVLGVAAQRAVVDVTARLAPTGPPTGDRVRTSDTAMLLEGVPGVSLAANGGLSGIPAIHGLADDRVKITINGMMLAPACSGHMNPPLSYVAPVNLAAITVMAGLTPVSAGGDSIGGTVAVESARPVFAPTGIAVHASASIFARTNSSTTGGNASFSAATEHLRFGYTGAYVDADNYTAGGGETVKSTFYTTANHAIQLSAQRGGQVLTGEVSVQRLPAQGYANARMDMTRNDSTLGNLRYESTAAWGRVDARGYVERTRHEMNILRDKIPGMNMPMETEGMNLGYSVALDRRIGTSHLLRAGSDLHRFTLDDWWPGVMPMVGSMGPDTLWNLRNGRRTRAGAYGEWESRLGAWTTLAGVRTDVVAMNTDNVTGYNMSPTATGSAAYYADAAEFNARDHARRDVNLDATLLARTAPTSTTSLEAGYARKTRSPNLYERYLWVKRSNMAVQMNGWFGDANGYTGNLDLQPEVAHTLSGTASWHSAGARNRELSVTPYVTRVTDYIDVDRCAVIAGSNGCTAAKLTATTGFVNLQFTNHDARLYGFDLAGHTPLGGSDHVGHFDLTGTVNYVRGSILDTGDNLYRLMPLDTRLTLEHRLDNWSSSVVLQGVAARDRVQAVRNELATPGYALINLRTGYQFRTLRVDVGLDNVADRRYILPLGGRYWIGDTTGASGVPGIGRSLYLGLTAKL